MLRGQWIYENWRGLDITAWFVIVLGVFFLLVAIFPWGRVHFLWDTDGKRVGARPSFVGQIAKLTRVPKNRPVR
jgi:hypothetical protein